MNFGLVGKNISYSFSQKYFTQKFISLGLSNYSYEVFDIQNTNELPDLFKLPNLAGFNVTIPYKQDIMGLLDELSPEAEKIGAVNTVKIHNGKKKGFNTDATGFKDSLLPLLETQHTSALVLGSGGASKAVTYILEQLGIRYTVISRKGENSYDSLNREIVSSNFLLINTTPVGTFPKVEDSPPFPLEFITSQHLVYDLIYNPEETKFLRLAKERGAKTKNGLEMLHLQAEAAWNIWNDQD
ncbi:MAG: shikimate dehydrogenase [Flavobacteriaceae bacterium]|jgi:shikimate dehydrogenase|nr:shikimate dehydrogenase [Flavobacteriaceae bacterium]